MNTCTDDEQVNTDKILIGGPERNEMTAQFISEKEVDRLSVMPQDGTAPQCVCPECSKYTKTENYIYVVNEVMRRVRKERPHVAFEVLAYTDLWKCPEDTTLEKNVCVIEAVWNRTLGGLCTLLYGRISCKTALYACR